MQTEAPRKDIPVPVPLPDDLAQGGSKQLTQDQQHVRIPLGNAVPVGRHTDGTWTHAFQQPIVQQQSCAGLRQPPGRRSSHVRGHSRQIVHYCASEEGFAAFGTKNVTGRLLPISQNLGSFCRTWLPGRGGDAFIACLPLAPLAESTLVQHALPRVRGVNGQPSP
ncbi:hypothetical protein [Streptomyces sp. NPDC058304]|uniref:hypothetical protein n=1 Tax=Streptomyces sp. NPDC058304 TaxID=3346437 RepID=UPI0036E6FA34